MGLLLSNNIIIVTKNAKSNIRTNNRNRNN